MTLHLDDRSDSTRCESPHRVAVCRLDELLPERGVTALVEGTQVAIFRLVDDCVLAVQQLDPFSGAWVMSRGIVGSRGSAPTVASPMYKQVFDLRDGTCLDAKGREPVDLTRYAVHVARDIVHLVLPGPDCTPTGAQG